MVGIASEDDGPAVVVFVFEREAGFEGVVGAFLSSVNPGLAMLGLCGCDCDEEGWTVVANDGGIDDSARAASSAFS